MVSKLAKMKGSHNIGLCSKHHRAVRPLTATTFGDPRLLVWIRPYFIKQPEKLDHLILVCSEIYSVPLCS